LSTALSKKAAALKAPRLEIRTLKFSALGILELLAGAGLAWLLALLFASVAGEIACALESGFVAFVHPDERPRNTMADRLGL
jgi:hypothetical protein